MPLRSVAMDTLATPGSLMACLGPGAAVTRQAVSRAAGGCLPCYPCGDAGRVPPPYPLGDPLPDGYPRPVAQWEVEWDGKHVSPGVYLTGQRCAVRECGKHPTEELAAALVSGGVRLSFTSRDGMAVWEPSGSPVHPASPTVRPMVAEAERQLRGVGWQAAWVGCDGERGPLTVHVPYGDLVKLLPGHGPGAVGGGGGSVPE